jgi:hypothetical protein
MVFIIRVLCALKLFFIKKIFTYNIEKYFIGVFNSKYKI